MNTKILKSLAVIGTVALLAIGGTVSYFSDAETSEGNIFTAGNLDLRVGSDCTYNGTPVDECAWQATDLNNELFFNYGDIKPADWGENTISLHIDDNPAWVCARISDIKNSENECNDPEIKIGDASCGNPGEGNGELQNYLKISVWRDKDCNNTQDPGEELIADDRPMRAGIEWPIADSNSGTGPITDACLGIKWYVPADTGNVIQTDSLIGNVSFYAEQSRNNQDFVCGGAVCGNSIIEPGEECDTNDVIYGGWGYHCDSDCTIRKCSLGQGRPCHVTIGGEMREGMQWCTDDGFWGDCEIEESIFEYYTIGDNDVNSVVDPKWEAQTFTPQTTHIIKKVKVKIYRLGLPGLVTLGIRATDTDGKPVGPDLATGVINGDTFTEDSDGAWYEIGLGDGATLSAGVKYAIVLGNSASGWARWRVAVPSSYEGGTCLTSFDSGNTWVFCDYGGYDALFEEWGIPI